MTTGAVLLVLTVGALLGYWAGRARAEWGRGRHDASKAWRGRADYRRTRR